MEIKEYTIMKKDLYGDILKFIENGNDLNDTYYQNLIHNIQKHKINEKSQELKEFLRIIIKISSNHHRYSDFFIKIEQIINVFKNNIKQTYSNSEIFNLFKTNKLILFFLLKNDIFTVDKQICDQILDESKSDENYCFFFFPEIKPLLDEETKQQIESKMLKINENIFDQFDQKRKIGENDSYLANLIRNDSLDEFVSYTNKENLPLSSKIKPSIFETNSFLIKNKEPSLIEYAAFFRSIQIFQYLRKNNVELTPSLWLFAIHGRNPELIRLLKEKSIDPEDKTYKQCLKESIKCHHNEITNYILDNFLNKDEEMSIKESNFDDNAFAFGFRYENYSFMPDDFNNKIVFIYLCKYNYYNFVDLLLKTHGSIINSSIVITKQNILIEFKNKKFNEILINLLMKF